MLEDQFTADVIAARLLDPGLSPRAYDKAPMAAPTTEWAGLPDTLARLGLRPGAEIGERELVALLGGRHTATGVRVLSEPAFYDLTLMAPRTVSAVWSMLEGERRADVERAMMRAGWSLLNHLATVAPLVDGAELVRSYVAAVILHGVGTRSAAAGPIPPCLHVHACLFAVQDNDESLIAPHEATLADEDVKRECDAAAEAVLADHLAGFGYRISNTAGAGTGHSFEIDGLPAAVTQDDRYWGNTGCATGGSPYG